MRGLYNTTILSACIRCGREYTTKEEEEFTKREVVNNVMMGGVLCECGGYVQTPSGKRKMKLVPTCKVYIFEKLLSRVCIASNTKEEAIEHFKMVIGSTRGYNIDEATHQDLMRREILNTNYGKNEDEEKYVSLMNILSLDERLPRVLASSPFKEGKGE